jgi:hypothetical protein
MKKTLLLTFLSLSSVALFAKDKDEVITIQVLSTDAWNRTVTVHHMGTDGTASTNCDTNGSVSDPAGTGTASVNATTNCTTTSTPGTPAYTTTRNIQQETVHAVLPGGRQVSLWCQKQWRACMSLPEGSYKAQIDGGRTLWIFVPQLDNSEKRIKYHLQ